MPATLTCASNACACLGGSGRAHTCLPASPASLLPCLSVCLPPPPPLLPLLLLFQDANLSDVLMDRAVMNEVGWCGFVIVAAAQAARVWVLERWPAGPLVGMHMVCLHTSKN